MLAICNGVRAAIEIITFKQYRLGLIVISLKLNSIASFQLFMSKIKKNSRPSLLKPLDLIRERFSTKKSQVKIDSYQFLLNPLQKKDIKIPDNFKTGVIDSPNGKVNYYQTGRGPTIVFVHGWGGGAYQFISLMRGLRECGFTALAFDHLGHNPSTKRPATIKQMIATTDAVLQYVKKKHLDGLNAVVAHDIGCMITASAKPELIKDLPLFLIAPVFNFKLYFLKQIQQLQIRPAKLQQYARDFSANYDREYAEFELAKNLQHYSDDAVIAHDKNDELSPISDVVKFCAKFPLTKLLVTNKWGHERIINSETIWHELKSVLNYEDTTVNFSNIVRDQNS
jgi:esterase/lipase